MNAILLNQDFPNFLMGYAFTSSDIEGDGFENEVWERSREMLNRTFVREMEQLRGR